MDIKLKIILDFLKKDPKNIIWVKELDAEGTELNKVLEKANYQHILEHHNSLQNFLIYVATRFNISNVGVIRRKPNGSSYLNFEEIIKLNLTIKNKPLVEDAANGVPVKPVVAPNAANYQNNNARTYQPEIMQPHTQSQGLNAVQIESIMAKEKVSTLTEKVDDLKHRLKKEEKKVDRKETQIEQLVIDLRTAKSDLANFQQKMDLEILKKEIEKSPAIPPEMLGKIVDNLPLVLGALQKAPIPATGLGASLDHLSKEQQNIIEMVSDTAITQEQAVFLERAVFGMLNNSTVTQTVQTVLTQQNI